MLKSYSSESGGTGVLQKLMYHSAGLRKLAEGRDSDSSKRFTPCREAAVGYPAGTHSTPSRRHRRRQALLHDGDIPTRGDTVPGRKVRRRSGELEEPARGLWRHGDAVAAARAHCARSSPTLRQMQPTRSATAQPTIAARIERQSSVDGSVSRMWVSRNRISLPTAPAL